MLISCNKRSRNTYDTIFWKELSILPKLPLCRRRIHLCSFLNLLFLFVLFQWLGLGIMAVGVWAWTEKDTFNNLSRLTNVALDPAFILILVGE